MAKINYTDKNNSATDGVANKWRDIDANEVKNSVNAVYPVVEAFSSGLTFDRNKYMSSAVAQAGAITYTLAASGHEDGVCIRHKILSDGSAISFPAAANGTTYPPSPTFESGKVYSIFFLYLGGDIEINIPGAAEQATATNSAPTVANAIPEQTQTEGYGSFTVDLTNVFADADGDTLTYSATSSNTGIATVGVTGTTLTVTEVAGTGTVNITVTANDGNGGTVSDVFALTVNAVAATQLTTPTLNAPTVVSASQIDLSWTDVANESNYELQRSTDNATWSTIASPAANSTTYGNTGLTASTTYYYRLRAIGDGTTYSNSDYSVSVNATTQGGNTAPSVTVPLSDQSVTEGYAELRVSYFDTFDDPDMEGLDVVAVSSNTAIATVAVDTNFTELVISEVAGTGNVTITVTVTDPHGASATDEFVLTVSAAAVASQIPTITGTKLKAHYIAEPAYYTKNASNTILAINDQSGNGFNLDTIYGTGPSVGASGGIYFDGKEVIYKAGHIISGGAARTMVAVILPDTTPNAVGLLAADGDAADQYGIFATSVTKSSDYAVRINGGATLYNKPVTTAKQVVTLNMPTANVGNAEMRVDGTALTVKTLGSVTLNVQAGGYFSLGGQINSGGAAPDLTAFVGTIYEVVYCDGLTAQQITDVENELKTKHGIA